MGRWALWVALWCCSTGSGMAQSFDGLKGIHSGLAQCEGDACLMVHDTLVTALEELLSQPGAMRDLPVTADFMAAVASEDKTLRVFTWNWAHPDRTSGYGGLVAQADDQGGITFTRLLDPSSADAPNERDILDVEEWCGALYYAMIPQPVDKGTWLLLGWDDADAQVTRKVIEPLQIKARGLRFGAPVLQSDRGTQRRHVLEYADAVQASLRHQPKKGGKDGHPERILFDHLAPQEPHLTGVTAYYGPDMTFDAYVPAKRGSTWVLQQQVDAIQPLQTDRPFNDPRPRNRR